MSSVEANGVSIEYEVRGEGPPVLLVMGLGGQLTDWPEELVDGFVNRGFKTIVFDNRDSGLSSETDWEAPGLPATIRSYLLRRKLKGVDYTIDDMAADAAGLLTALDIGPAHVVGISMGGMISQAMAINHPGLVVSLCSIMSNPGDRRNGMMTGRLMMKARKLQSTSRENAVEQSLETFVLIGGENFDPDSQRPLVERSVERSYRPEGMSRQTAAIAGSPDRTSGLRRLKVPTLVIHGLQDPLVKPSGGIATAKAVGGSRLLMFPDMGHDLPANRTDETIDAIIANFSRAAVPAR